MTAPLVFWRHVAFTESCWLWMGALTRGGYGQASKPGVRSRNMLAHRLAYEMCVGPIPVGLQLDHVKDRGCRHRNCVNPAHLEPVTNRTNALRGVSPTAVNARKTHCRRGHAFTPENTCVERDGGRVCRTCRRDRKRAARGGAR